MLHEPPTCQHCQFVLSYEGLDIYDCPHVYRTLVAQGADDEVGFEYVEDLLLKLKMNEITESGLPFREWIQSSDCPKYLQGCIIALDMLGVKIP